MSNWEYDSGGHKTNEQLYKEGYERIFGKKKEVKYCPECGMREGVHKVDCSLNKKVEKDG